MQADSYVWKLSFFPDFRTVFAFQVSQFAQINPFPRVPLSLEKLLRAVGSVAVSGLLDVPQGRSYNIARLAKLDGVGN
jgi:hypothetical protein